MSTSGISVPCFDCLDQVNPYNPFSWLYVATTPKNATDAAALSCSTGGDYNLGVIVNKCESMSDPPTPPVSVNGVPYRIFTEDCSFNGSCQGPAFQIPKCGNPASDSAYGLCGLKADAHFWWVRDWDTELADPLSVVQCCVTPPSVNRTEVCPPNLWAGSSNCANVMQSFCNWQTWPASYGDGSTSTSTSASPTSTCDSFMEQRLQTQDVTGAANQTFLNALSSWASVVESQGPSVDDPFIPYVIKWCSGQGSLYGPQGMCNTYLEQACSQVTAEDIANDSTGTLGKVCGCFLPSYQNLLPGIIPQECNALCSIQKSIGGIPLYQLGAGGVPSVKQCEQTSCVIDNATINMINSAGGDVSFSQVCGGCPNGGCTCIINGVSEQIINSQVNNIDFNQNCTSCSSQNGGSCPPLPTPSLSSPFTKALPWIIIACIVLLVIIVFVIGLMR